MTRRADQFSRLAAVIEAHRETPFEWGANDCAHFVARCLDAMIDGADFEAAVAELYESEAEAKDVIKDRGGFAAAVAGVLGKPVKGRALRGDVVTVAGEGDQALAIFDGRHALALGPGGLHRLERDQIIEVWRV